MSRSRRTLVVLPDAERVEEALVQAATEEGGFVDGTRFVHLSGLLDRLGAAAKLGRKKCSPLTARVLLWAAARDLGEGPFGSFVHEPAFARAAQELIVDLKAGALPPDGFARAVEKLPSLRVPRARYLSKLYVAYERALSKHLLADREDLVRGAIERLRSDGLPPAFEGFVGVELRGLHDFPTLKKQLVLELASACEQRGLDFRLVVPGAGSQTLDAAVDEVFGTLERHAQTHTHVEALKDDLREGHPLAELASELFSNRKRADPFSADALECFSAATAREEAYGLALRARQAVEAGVAPERVVVAYRELGQEAEWVSEALEDLGVPARVRRGAPLLGTAVGRVALDLPLLVDDDFPAERMAQLIASRYLKKVQVRERISVGATFAVASIRDDLLGAEEGKGAYRVRLEALAKRLENRGREWNARDVRVLLESSETLIQICRKYLPSEAKAKQLLQGWKRALQDLGLFDAIREPEARDAEGTVLGRAVLRALARDQAAGDSLRAMWTELEQALTTSGASGQVMARRTFSRWLLDAAADFNLAPRGPRGGAVRILDVRELGGRTYDVLCLGGLADGRFPGRAPPHPLFSDDDRAAVNKEQKREVFRLGSGEVEGRAAWRLAEDRFLFFVALASARERAVLSTSREGPTGQEQVPSAFLDELQRLAPVKLEKVPSRPVPSLDDVNTEAQLRERAAIEALADRAIRLFAPDPAASLLAERVAGEPWLDEAARLSAIESERLRYFSNPEEEPGRFTGDLAAPELTEPLSMLFRFGPERPLSASMLETYGNCAYQGFLKYVLRIEEREESGEELDARGKGSFWHLVLEKLFPRLREAGLLRREPEDVPDELIDLSVEEAAKEAESQNHVGHPALWKLGRERARTMVRRLLRSSHRGLPFDGHEPEHTELSFGKKDSPEGWQQIVIPAGPGEAPIHLEGKIDRVDRSGKSVGLIDYKTSLPTKAKLKEQLLDSKFQLPLYLYAARAAGHPGAIHAAWLVLKDGFTLHLNELLDGTSIDELLADHWEERKRIEALEGKNFANAVHELVAGLRQGRFPIRSEDCRYCAFRAVCRITERRVEEGAAA